MLNIAPLLRGPALLPAIFLIDIAIIVIDPLVVQTVATAKCDVTANVATPVSMVTKMTEASWSMDLIRGRIRQRIRLGNLHIKVTEIT
jgi:hypothetical protein